MGKRSLISWIAGGLAAAILLAAAWIPLPYYSEGPGPAREVVPLIAVDGPPTYEAGRFIMTTVAFDQLTGMTALRAWIDDDIRVVDRDVLYPDGQTVAQERERSLSQMDASKITAAFVALGAVTDYPKDRGDGVLIQTVFSDCPAEGELFPGDVVHSIEGHAIAGQADASRAIEAVPPGDPVTFRVSAGGEEHAVTVTRGECPGADEPVIGISMVPNFPFDVEISSGDIGGPSAGLMYALGLYDLLTPGDLTDGRLVAGTGAMGLDGSVGPIGGIGDKVVAARRAEADVFLVPGGNLEEAGEVDAGEMELVPVDSFEAALEALGVEVADEGAAAT
jgi:PDZ domain-containing protein